jgi:hypothetical protein
LLLDIPLHIDTDETRQYIQESMGREEAERAAMGGIGQGEKISRSTLEDEARESTLRGHGTPEERFWQRQRGQAETIAIGRGYISKVCTLSLSRRTTNFPKAAPTETKKEK